MFTQAHAQRVMAQARVILANEKRDRASAHDRSSAPKLDLVFKTRDDAQLPADDADDDDDTARARSVSVASGSELPWQEWVESFVDDRLLAAVDQIGKEAGELLDELRRELRLLQREIVQVREQLGLARELKELRGQIETAKNQVPKLPELMSGLKQDQTRLQREVARTKEKVSKLRADQSIADFKLNELRKATAARSTAIEAKVETTVSTFRMQQIDPDAAAALKSFATATLESSQRNDGKLWLFDPNPGPAAGSA
jgi:hypothetical protein